MAQKTDRAHPRAHRGFQNQGIAAVAAGFIAVAAACKHETVPNYVSQTLRAWETLLELDEGLLGHATGKPGQSKFKRQTKVIRRAQEEARA